jgi:hypothetical protein
MARQILLTFFSITLLIGCANKVKKSERIEQGYNYSSILYIPLNKDEEVAKNKLTGIIDFSENSIILNMDNNSQLANGKFNIRTVTYSNKPSEIKYRTDKGEFDIKTKNNTIEEVTLSTNQFIATFYKAKMVKSSSYQLSASVSKPQDDWKRIKIKDVGTIDLPPKMEIQKGKFKKNKEEYLKNRKDIWEIDLNNSKLIFQPKGLNAYDKKALKKYARVIFRTITGNPGDFHKINKEISLSEQELSNLNQSFKAGIMKNFSQTPLKLTKWHSTQLVEINNVPAIKISYKRQLKQQPYVIVDIYRFQNYDCMYSLTLSYRENEKEYWEETLNKVLQSFRITNIK